jgi:hypothetical protein
MNDEGRISSKATLAERDSGKATMPQARNEQIPVENSRAVPMGRASSAFSPVYSLSLQVKRTIRAFPLR